MDGMISDTRENVGEVGLRIDTVHFAAFDDGVHTGGALSAGIGAAKEVFFRPRTGGFMARSAALFDISRRPLAI